MGTHGMTELTYSQAMIPSGLTTILMDLETISTTALKHLEMLQMETSDVSTVMVTHGQTAVISYRKILRNG